MMFFVGLLFVLLSVLRTQGHSVRKFKNARTCPRGTNGLTRQECEQYAATKIKIVNWRGRPTGCFVRWSDNKVRFNRKPNGNASVFASLLCSGAAPTPIPPIPRPTATPPSPTKPAGCPLFMCRMHCEFGFQKKNGCTICACQSVPSTCDECTEEGYGWIGRRCISDCAMLADAACYTGETGCDEWRNNLAEREACERATNCKGCINAGENCYWNKQGSTCILRGMSMWKPPPGGRTCVDCVDQSLCTFLLGSGNSSNCNKNVSNGKKVKDLCPKSCDNC